MKIRTRLLILMFCLVAVSLTLTGVLSYRVNSSFLKEDIIALQKEKTLAAVALIDSFLDIHKQRVQDQSEYLYSLIHLHRGDIISSLQQFLNSSPFYREEALVQRNGRELARISRHTFYIAGEMRNFSKDDLFVKVLKDKVYRFKDVQRNEFGEPVIELYYPVLDAKKEVSHVIIHSMNLKPLWDTISDIKLGKTGFAFVVDRQGYVIAHPDFSTVLSKANVSGLTIFNRLVNTKQKSYGEGAVMNAHESGHFYSGGVSEETGWLVIVTQDSSEANRPLFYIVRALLLGMGAILALGAAFSVIFSKRFTAPLLILTEGVKNIARGNLDFQARIRSKDEVGELARGFNAMADSLRTTTVSKDYFDNIIESLINALIVVSSDGRIIRSNAAANALLGYTENEMINQPVGMIFEGEPPFKITELESAFRKGPIGNMETTYRSKDGGKVAVLFSASVIRDSTNNIRDMVCVAQDISARKHAEEQLKRYADELKQANEEMKNFAYIVSHDLRAPLVSIKGFAGELNYALKALDGVVEIGLPHLNDKDRTNAENVYKKDVPQAIEFINSSVSRMDGLIAAVLSLSRLGHRELKPEPVDMTSLARSILKSLAHQLGKNNVNVSVAELPLITADRLSMEQVMGNILDNALKYLEPGRDGEIVITAEMGAEETTFHIRDNGRGIAKEDMHKVFEIFRRAGKQDVPGEGMGLAYVKTLIRRHGGRIWCESEPGKGSVFSFTSPAAGAGG